MKKTVEFYSEGNKIAGELYLPDDLSPGVQYPGIVLCHGFSGIKELLLPAYAERFAQNGYCALTFDYRGFGDSEGSSGRIVPEEQQADIRNALTFLESREEVDGSKIGLWGTSFGGANVISVARTDKRVKCLVAQLTFANGERIITQGQSPEEKAKLLSMISKAWQRDVTRNKPMTLTPEQILTDEQSKAFYSEAVLKFPKLAVKIPFLTIRRTMEYKPEEVVPDVSVPIFILGAENDLVNPVEESRIIFRKANEPKGLHIVPGAGHYEVYSGEYFEQSFGKELEWFNKYLAN